MHKAYQIRLYDTPVIEFTMYRNQYKETIIQLTDYDRDNKSALPIGFEATDKGLEKWLRERIVPKGRKYVNQILASLNLSAGDVKGILDISMGLSLNDSYWVVPFDFKGCFNDYNLYDNGFSEILSLTAYTGRAESSPHTSSPELSTDGSLPKAWRRKNDGIYLYKGSSDKTLSGIGGKEPYSEYFCSQVAKCMGLNAVCYSMEKWCGSVASVCELFNSKDISFIPVYKFGVKNLFSDLSIFYAQQNIKWLDDLKSMLVFDSVICNVDRHTKNFGFLRDNHTGSIISPAPIFDNGLSVINFASDDINGSAAALSPAQTPLSFEDLCGFSSGDVQMEQLERLKNFIYVPHPEFNLPFEFTEKAQDFIKKRAAHLLHCNRSVSLVKKESVRDKLAKNKEKISKDTSITKVSKSKDISL